MFRLICALVLVLLISTPSLGQQSLVGTYKLVSRSIEVDGTVSKTMGTAPHGYFVLTPTRAVQFYTEDNRKFGTSVAEKAALFDTLVGCQDCIVSRETSSSSVWTFRGSKT